MFYLLVKMKVLSYLYTAPCRCVGGVAVEICVYSVSEQQIEVNDQFQPVAASCQ